MKNTQLQKIIKSFLLAFAMTTTFGAMNAQAFQNCENRKSSILCQQSERQKVQSMNFEILNNLTNFKLSKLINLKLQTTNVGITPTTNDFWVKNSNKKLKNYGRIRPKFINRNYEFAILALDQKGLGDLLQCAAAVDKNNYPRAVGNNSIKIQTAINLVNGLLTNSVENKSITDSLTKPSSVKCNQLFGLIFGSTFEI